MQEVIAKSFLFWYGVYNTELVVYLSIFGVVEVFYGRLNIFELFKRNQYEYNIRKIVAQSTKY